MQSGYTSNLSTGSGLPHGCGNQQGGTFQQKPVSGNGYSENLRLVRENEKRKATALCSETPSERRKKMNLERRKNEFLDAYRQGQEEKQYTRRKRVKKEESTTPTLPSPPPSPWGNKPVFLDPSERKRALSQCQSRQQLRDDVASRDVYKKYEQKGSLYQNKFRLL